MSEPLQSRTSPLIFDVAAEMISGLSELVSSEGEGYFKVWPSGRISVELDNVCLMSLTKRLVICVQNNMSKRPAKAILTEAEELLQTAKFGLEDMGRTARAKSGLRNAVVFGRTVTFALQNLSSVVPEFDAWYAAKVTEMKADPLMRYFRDLRTTIEKKASTPTGHFVEITHFDSSDLSRFEPRPPGATAFFIGGPDGGAGWEVAKPDGSFEHYYIDLPPDVGTTGLMLTDVPDAVAKGRSANELVAQYLSAIEVILKEAKTRFG